MNNEGLLNFIEKISITWNSSKDDEEIKNLVNVFNQNLRTLYLELKKINFNDKNRILKEIVEIINLLEYQKEKKQLLISKFNLLKTDLITKLRYSNIFDMLESSNLNMKLKALELSHSIQDKDTRIQIILECLEDLDYDIIFRALELSYSIPDENVQRKRERAILELLESIDFEVILKALELSHSIPDENVQRKRIQIILDFLEHSDWEARLEILALSQSIQDESVQRKRKRIILELENIDKLPDLDDIKRHVLYKYQKSSFFSKFTRVFFKKLVLILSYYHLISI